MNVFQLVLSAGFLFGFPAQKPDIDKFTRFFAGGLAISAMALITAVAVGKYFIPVTFGAFVITGLFRVVQLIFVFSVVSRLLTG